MVPAGAATAPMNSAAFSPTMTVGACVLPPGMSGMIDASATRSPAMPRTTSLASTTAIGSVPMRQVPTGWNVVIALARSQAASAASLRTAAPGASSRPHQGANAGWPITARTMRTPAIIASRSASRRK